MADHALTPGFVRALARVLVNAARPPVWVLEIDDAGIRPPELGRPVNRSGVVLAPVLPEGREWPGEDVEAILRRRGHLPSGGADSGQSAALKR